MLRAVAAAGASEHEIDPMRLRPHAYVFAMASTGTAKHGYARGGRRVFAPRAAGCPHCVNDHRSR